MKYSQSEKMEIIRMVEGSSLSVKKTLEEIGISRSTFYEWYKRYQEDGFEGLRSRNKSPRQVWNKIPEWERQRVVQVARIYPEKSSREVACHITDNMNYFISESSVYRILKTLVHRGYITLSGDGLYRSVSQPSKFAPRSRAIRSI